MRDSVCVYCRNCCDVKSECKLEQATEDHIVSYSGNCDSSFPTLPLLPSSSALLLLPLRSPSLRPSSLRSGDSERVRFRGRRRRAPSSGRSGRVGEVESRHE